MKILVLNCGSSSLKFRLIDLEADASPRNLFRGLVKRIGADASYDFKTVDGLSHAGDIRVNNHYEAVKLALNWMGSGECSLDDRVPGIRVDAVGHRIVHGGSRFTGPVLLDEWVVDEIAALSSLAPLHNPVSVEGIRAARSLLGESVPMVAVFDTGYHDGIPEYASIYAIPYELTKKHDIKRYGPHGIAHRYMAQRFSEITGIPLADAKIITLQLGNGSSIAAVSGGKHVDTSMGFTPLEGLVMGTRSGDLDPAVIFFLARMEKLSIDELDELLNFKSGLFGISGISNDMAKILESVSKSADNRARLAIDTFCYRIRKYIGAYLAVLEGADAVVFGGGIGENAAAIREKICNGLAWYGLKLDPDLNAAALGLEAQISMEYSTVRAMVIPVDEEMLIARETAHCLQGEKIKSAIIQTAGANSSEMEAKGSGTL